MSISLSLFRQAAHNSISKAIQTMDNEFPSTPFKSSEAYANEMVAQTTKAYDEYCDRLTQGIQALTYNNILSSDDIDTEKIPQILLKIQFPNQTNIVLQDEFGLSDETMMRCYTYASELLTAKQPKEAGDIFLVLTFFNFRIAAFWVGLGIAEENRNEYQSALIAYLMALEVHPDDLDPALFGASVLVQLHEKDKALLLLDQALEQAANDKKYDIFRSKVIDIKQRILR